MKHTWAILLVALCFVGGQLGTAGGAQAEETPDPVWAGEPLVTEGSATVETYTAGFEDLVSTATYGPETEDQVMPAEGIGVVSEVGGSKVVVQKASGTGGSTTASGCRKVTITNTKRTTLGFTAFKYHTWTRWCWTRSSQVVSSVTTGWSISDVDSQFYWKGNVNSEFGFYDYSTNDGHPKSAYKHYRQGRFENCVFKYGCIGNWYPANTLRSYYNGTWAWSTSG